MFDKNDAKIEQERAEAEEKRQRTGFKSPHGDEWRWLCSCWQLRLPVLFVWLVGRFFASFCMRATFCPQAGRDEQGSRERELQPNDQTSQGDVLARAKLLLKHVLVSKLATDRLLEPTISLSWLSLLGLPAWWLFHNVLGACFVGGPPFFGLVSEASHARFLSGFQPRAHPPPFRIIKNCEQIFDSIASSQGLHWIFLGHLQRISWWGVCCKVAL